MTSKASNTGLSVVLADDHRMLRECMASALGRNGIRVVGRAATGEAAIRMVKRLKPDLVVMDVSMPGMGGIGATAELRKITMGVPVIALSLWDDAATASQMIRAGASAFVPKGDLERLISVIRHVAGERGRQTRRRSNGNPTDR